MRPLATILLLAAASLASPAASAQVPPAERPPVARPAPQPAQRLDRDAILRRRRYTRQVRELLLQEVRLLERLVGPLTPSPRPPPATPRATVGA